MPRLPSFYLICRIILFSRLPLLRLHSSLAFRCLKMSTKVASDPDCIFCKIIAGKIPSKKVLETDSVLAFMDIGPIAAGHCLVIPKHHAEKLHELPEEAAEAVGSALVKVSRAVVKATGCKDYNILQNNGKIAHQEVGHVHFHIIPKPEESQGLTISSWSATAQKIKSGELKAAAVDDMHKAVVANL